MSFEDVKTLGNSYSRINAFIDYIECKIEEDADIGEYSDLIYRAAISIRLNIDDFVANNCYLAVPGLLLDIKNGFFLTTTYSKEECDTMTKDRLLTIAKNNTEVYTNIKEIFNKDSFFYNYIPKLLSDIASNNVENLLFD